MSDFDDEPRGRSATGAVVIAVIFLAILGTGVGIVLGAQHKNSERDNAANESSPTATATTPTGPATSNPTPTNTKTPTGNKSFRPTTRDKCPDQTVEAAGTSLNVKRFIKTNRSEVWICTGGGKTYYQGHQLGTAFNGATTNTSLFLSTVAPEGDVFIANNGDTNYIVGKEFLRIEKNGNVISDEEVVDLFEG